jgi:hypothetical protein
MLIKPINNISICQGDSLFDMNIFTNNKAKEEKKNFNELFLLVLFLNVNFAYIKYDTITPVIYAAAIEALLL